MRIKNAKTFLAGAVGGVALLIACGSDSVINAIDVLFDNTGTNLAATNVQDAIKEVAPPKVTDADGNELGIFQGPGPSSGLGVPSIDVYNRTLNGVLVLEMDGTVRNHGLWFESADCSGTPYSVYNNVWIEIFGSNAYMRTSTTTTSKSIQSILQPSGACNTDSFTLDVYSMGAVTTPFPLPITGPIQIVP